MFLAFFAQANETNKNAFADLSIEQLMNESVTSVSKKETKLADSPAAISVLTQDDIRRLGVASLPEALRGVPGLDVARINGHTWAISARGFQSQFGTKLLVMIDGRSVYQSSFAGVFWDLEDVVLEDLDRIEVIRGPGATLWGANAVNGVINIITKSARDTQGWLASSTFGTEEQPSTTLRYGGHSGSNLYYRVYVKYFNRDGLVDSSGQDAPDDSWGVHGGARLDWEPTVQDQYTLQGDYGYYEPVGTYDHRLLAPPFLRVFNATDHNKSGNFLGRWSHTFSESSQLSLQSFYTHTAHTLGDGGEVSDTLDFDLQDRFGLGEWNDIVCGVGYRVISDNLPPSEVLTWTPQKRTMNLFTAFVQDEITVRPERLKLILGSKFEHNVDTGFEVQPGARLLWTPSSRQTAWAAVSRAVRTPSRFDRGARVEVAGFQPDPFAPVMDVALIGNPHLKAEQLIAYEIGYRVEPVKQISIDATAFYNRYKNLIGYLPGSPTFELSPPPPHLLLPQYAANNGRGETYGAEVSLQYKVIDCWRLAADYSWIHPGALAKLGELNSAIPQQQARLRSYLDLPHNFELNSSIAYVDRLSNLKVSSYVRLDAGVIWRPLSSLELGIWGQNLLESRHWEFPSQLSSFRTEMPRSFFGKITWKF
ncbi:MAG TPA: TonB-dependent receptor [Verrucomicrobiae bacterium]